MNFGRIINMYIQMKTIMWEIDFPPTGEYDVFYGAEK